MTMSDNTQAKLFSSLRGSTATLLGYSDADKLTAAQQIRVDRAIALRLVIDDAQAKQMRGEQIDVKSFVAASEDLEKMCGGNLVETPATRFGASHRERLRALIEKTLATDEVAEAERMADIYDREEMAAIIAAGGNVEAAPAPASSVPAPVALPPPRPLTDIEKMDRVNSKPALPPRGAEPWKAFEDDGSKTAWFKPHG
jgi:hypothetical protein